MPTQVNVPGQGTIEFPDGMDDEQIKGVIKRKFFSGGGTTPSQPEEPPNAQVLGFKDTLGAIQGLLETGGAKALNTLLFPGTEQHPSAPVFEPGKTIVPQGLMRTVVENLPTVGHFLGHAVAPEFTSGVEQQAADTLSGFTTPGNVVAAPLGMVKGLGLPSQLYYGTSMAAQLPESVQAVREAQGPKQMGQAVTGLVSDVGMLGLMGHGLLPGEEPATPQASPIYRPFTATPNVTPADLGGAMQEVAARILQQQQLTPPTESAPPQGLVTPSTESPPTPAPSVSLQGPIEAKDLAQTGVVPAIKPVTGQVVTGKDHVSAYKKAKATVSPDTSGSQEGFVNAQGQFISRQQAAQQTGIPTQVQPGALHSGDLERQEQQNAQGLREDAGQVLQSGTVPQTSAGEGGANLEREAQREVSGGTGPQVAAKGGNIMSEEAASLRHDLLPWLPPEQQQAIARFYTETGDLKEATRMATAQRQRVLDEKAGKTAPEQGITEGTADYQARLRVWREKHPGFEGPGSPVQGVYTPAKEALPPGDRMVYDALKLDTESNAGQVLRNMAAAPDQVGEKYAGLARFLDEKFGHVLNTVSIGLGRGAAEGGHYSLTDNTAYLDLPDHRIPLPLKVLEETAHAATYWQFQFPKNEVEYKAVQSIKAIRERAAKEGLTANEWGFLQGPYADLMAKRATTGFAPQSHWEAFDKAGVLRERGDLLYRLHSDHEHIAGLFADAKYRRLLNSFAFEDRSGLDAFIDKVKTLLGVKPESGLDASFNALINVAEARGMGWERAKDVFGVGPGVPPGPPGPSPVRDITDKEWLKQRAFYLSGWSSPKHVAVSEDLGNAGIAYGSSRLIAEYWPKALATQVLGARQDVNFRRVLGAVMAQGQFDGLRQSLTEAADKETDPAKKADLLDRASKVTNVWNLPKSPIRDQAEYERVKANPQVAAAVERHLTLVQPEAEKAQVGIGGKLREGDPETGAFINMKALLGEEDEAAVRANLYTSKRGDITSGLRRGTVFGREFKGTGKAYEFDYRTLAERMLRGNLEQYNLRQYIDQLERNGMAVEQKAGMKPPPPTAKGVNLVDRTIELRGAGPGQTRHIKLWLHPDVLSEFDGLRKTDSLAKRGALGLMIDAVNDVQVLGLIDATYHTKNMITAIANSQGGGNVWYDLVRKAGAVPMGGVPGSVGIADALGRIVYNVTRVAMDTPEVQKELAQIALAGAARSGQVHKGIVGKALAKVGGPEWLDPNYWSGRAINSLDKAGRVTLNQMFNTLVEANIAKDTVLDRREFVNKMGQYNGQLMGEFSRKAREWGFGPFVVAVKNFNRNAVLRLMSDPGFRAANPKAAFQTHMVEWVTLLTSLAVIPAIFNYARTGSPFGRPGVKVGQIDLGTDDEQGRPKVFDPQASNLIRRGLGVTGVGSLLEGLRGQPINVGETAKAVVDANTRPFIGPALRAGITAASGRTPFGQPISRNPYVFGENVKAAVQQANPLLAGALGFYESVPGGARTPVQTFEQAVGYTSGRFPSLQERMQEKEQRQGRKMTPAERVAFTRDMQAQDKEHPMSDMQKGAAGERYHWKGVGREQDLQARLPQEQKAFLATNKLSLPGFQEEVTQGHVKMPLTKPEQDKAMEIYARRYQEAIAAVMKQPDFDKQTQVRKQVILQRVLDRYRAAARAEVRRAIRPTDQP